MHSRLLIACIGAAIVLASVPPAHAWTIFGRLRPGEIKLGSWWPDEKAIRTMLRQHASIGGRFCDDSYPFFSAMYLYRGREVSVQRMINDLNRLQLEGTTVVLVEDEGFETFFGRPQETVSYDWALALSSPTFVLDTFEQLPPPTKRLNVTMIVFLGTRLDRTKLRIPEWMRSSSVRTPQRGNDGPVSAFQAIARAARDD